MMSDEMYRERIRSLEEHTDKLVAQSDALKAQLAERDAEIERLRQQVEQWQSKAEQIYNLHGEWAMGNVSFDAVSEALIGALRQQVAELEAWKANVPVKELNRMMTVAPFDSVEADMVWKWLKFSR